MRRLTIAAVGTDFKQLDALAISVLNTVRILESDGEYEDVNVSVQVVPKEMVGSGGGSTNVIGFHYDESCEGYEEEGEEYEEE